MSTISEATASLTFAVSRRPDPLPDAELARVLADPGFGKFFTDHMVTASWTAGQGWHDGTRHGIRADLAHASGRGAALRTGGLRGAQGLPPRGRLGVELPPGRQRATVASQRRAAGPAAAVGGRLPRLAQNPRRGRRTLGAGVRHGGDEPLPAPVHVRLGGLPRGSAGQGGHLLGHRLAGRRLLQRRRQAGHGCGCRWTTPGPAKAARARPNAAATTPPASPASSRASGTTATRPSSWTRALTPTSKSSAA